MIAILGATGYVGGSLARLLAARGATLHLFCRNPGILGEKSWPAKVRVRPLEEFDAAPFSLTINAIGPGDPTRVAALGDDITDLTRRWDDRVLSSMGSDSAYVFVSSGAVHDAALRSAAETAAKAQLSPYARAKIETEARHRALAERHVLDIRVFSYADQSISLAAGFFLAELARSVLEGTPFVTTSADMIRDYTGPEEFLALVDCWRSAESPNRALDIYSREPVAKSAILDAARARYGITIIRSDDTMNATPPPRPVYVPRSNEAAELGYEPRRISAELVFACLDSLWRPAGRGEHIPA